MKVLLAALNAKYVHSNLAVYDIEAYAKSHSAFNGELLVKEYTINHNLDAILRMIYQVQADVVAFSCYIWNIREILSIAKDLKKIQKSVKIWLGGPEVSYNSTELLTRHSFIDGIMRGEGEVTFAELLEVWECSEDIGAVQGVTWRDESGTVTTNTNRSAVSMDDIPFIYDDLTGFENRIIYYETSRGCPFNCSYCLSSIDKTVRFRSLDLVYKELQFFLDTKVPQVKFIDRTFNCKKDRALDIWKYITEHDNGVTNFHFEISSDLLGSEEIELFSRMRPGLIQLEIGLQTTNPTTVQEIRRTMNIDKVRDNMLRIRNLGNIHQHLDLIAGLPYEDYDSFKQSFDDAYAMRPHQLQLGFLKVLKGSHMEEMCNEYELVYSDEQPYEVMSTKWISYDEILQLKRVEEMVEIYHNSGQFDNVLKYLQTRYASPFQLFMELGDYYESSGLFGIGFKREARYEVLRDFAVGKFGVDKVFDDLLTYDYYLRENVRNRPSWSPEEPISKEMYKAFFRAGGTSEYKLSDPNKTASKVMHIEPLTIDAYRIISGSEDCSDVRVKYCLFDYENRDRLSNNASVVVLDKIDDNE